MIAHLVAFSSGVVVPQGVSAFLPEVGYPPPPSSDCPHTFSADGSTEDIGVPLEDVQARKEVCAPGQQHMYPLGDGRGGLLTRRRWSGSPPQPQHVQHIGEDNLVP